MLFQSSVVLIRCHFNQVSFGSSVVWIKCHLDQVSFGSSVVWIKCRLDQVSFGSSVVSIKCRLDQVSFRSSVVTIKCCFDQVLFQSSIISIKCHLITCHSINCQVMVEKSNCAKFFVYSICNKVTNDPGEVQQEVMFDEVETVKGFCYLDDRLNASGGCKAAVTARTRVGWKKFKECGEILFRKRFSLWMKGKTYKSYVCYTEVKHGV